MKLLTAEEKEKFINEAILGENRFRCRINEIEKIVEELDVFLTSDDSYIVQELGLFAWFEKDETNDGNWNYILLSNMNKQFIEKGFWIYFYNNVIIREKDGEFSKFNITANKYYQLNGRRLHRIDIDDTNLEVFKSVEATHVYSMKYSNDDKRLESIILVLNKEKKTITHRNPVIDSTDEVFESKLIMDLSNNKEILKLDEKDIYIYGKKRSISSTLRFRTKYSFEEVVKLFSNNEVEYYAVQFVSDTSGSKVNSLIKIDKIKLTASVEKCQVMATFVAVESENGIVNGYFVAENSASTFINEKETEAISSSSYYGGKLESLSKMHTRKVNDKDERIFTPNVIFDPEENKFIKRDFAILAKTSDSQRQSKSILLYNKGNTLMKRVINRSSDKYGFDAITVQDTVVREISDGQKIFLGEYMFSQTKNDISRYFEGTDHQKCIYDEKEENIYFMTKNTGYHYWCSNSWHGSVEKKNKWLDLFLNKPSYKFDLSNNSFTKTNSYIPLLNEEIEYSDIINTLDTKSEKELKPVNLANKLSNKRS